MKRLVQSAILAAALASTAGLAKAQDIKIAVVGPITGSNAVKGEQMNRGAEMAIKDINANGGVLGKRLDLIVADDACDPRQALAAANDVVGKGVVFVVGHYCSSASIPASAVYNAASVLQMTPASTSTAVTDDAAKKGWNNVFRTCGRDDAQGALAGKYLADHYKGKRVAIVHDETAYGKGVADETIKAMNAAGLKQTMHEAVTQGDKDFSTLINKMKTGNIDVIYYGGYQAEAGLLVRQARNQALKAQFIGADALVTEDYWKIAGPAGEGTLTTYPPTRATCPPPGPSSTNSRPKTTIPKAARSTPTPRSRPSRKRPKRPSFLNVDDLSKALHSMAAHTVVGPLNWDKKGDVTDSKYVFYVWKNGTYAEM